MQSVMCLWVKPINYVERHQQDCKKPLREEDRNGGLCIMVKDNPAVGECEESYVSNQVSQPAIVVSKRRGEEGSWQPWPETAQHREFDSLSFSVFPYCLLKLLNV